MPRFVRNAYIEGSADGVASPFGTGPRVKGGWLSARITLRTRDAAVSDAIEITAGGNWVGTDDRDAADSAHAYFTIPPTMRVFTEPRADGGIELHIVQKG